MKILTDSWMSNKYIMLIFHEIILGAKLLNSKNSSLDSKVSISAFWTFRFPSSLLNFLLHFPPIRNGVRNAGLFSFIAK